MVFHAEFKRFFQFGILVFWVCSGFGAGAIEVTLVQSDGDEVSGELKSIDPKAGIVVADRLIKLEEIAEIRFDGAARNAASAKPRIHLRNGDVLLAEILSGGDKGLKLNQAWLGELEIKNNSLLGIVFPSKEPLLAAAIAGFLSGPALNEDLILTLKGETNKGYLEKFTAKELVFMENEQKRTLAFEQLAAFRFAALQEFKPPAGVLALLRLSDGSLLSGPLQGMADAKISIQHLEGGTWSLPAKELLALEFKGGKLVYLNELEPAVEEKPYVGGAPVVRRWRKNLSAAGERLRIGRKEFNRGLGVHSYCKLTFNLQGQYDRLLAEAGMDAAAPSGARCAWKVVVDGKEVAGGEAKAGEPAQKIKAALAGAKTVELICDYGSDLDDAGDLFDWVEARLLKK